MVDLASPAVRDWDFPRGVASVALLTSYGVDAGVDARDVLRGSGLTLEAIDDPTARVDAHQELTVARNLARALAGRPALGLDVGCRYRVSTFGIFGFACISSPTLRDAITFAFRYLDLSFTFCIPAVEVTAEELRMELHDERVPDDVRQFFVERDLAAIYTVMTDLLPDGIPLRTMRFRAVEPDYAGQFERVFGVMPGFGASTNLTTFDPSHLRRELPQASPHTVALCEAQCQALVTRVRARSGFPHLVRERLIRVGGAAMGMDSVARELSVSTRTLRRRLEETGTSYRALRHEVRSALAEELLGTGALSVEDVAIRLGYAE
ncbi:MAG: AraC family transcriptional regulator ligand-binding domain-containing protein, partial [Sciscionella sp.]